MYAWRVPCSIYVECADNTGVIEWDTVRNAFVAFFSNQTGYVSVAPGDDKVLVLGYDNIVNVLAPTSERPLFVALFGLREVSGSVLHFVQRVAGRGAMSLGWNRQPLQHLTGRT